MKYFKNKTADWSRIYSFTSEKQTLRMLLKLAGVCSALQEQQTLEQIFTQIKNYSRTFWGLKSEKNNPDMGNIWYSLPAEVGTSK